MVAHLSPPTRVRSPFPNPHPVNIVLPKLLILYSCAPYAAERPFRTETQESGNTKLCQAQLAAQSPIRWYTSSSFTAPWHSTASTAHLHIKEPRHNAIVVAAAVERYTTAPQRSVSREDRLKLNSSSHRESAYDLFGSSICYSSPP